MCRTQFHMCSCQVVDLLGDGATPWCITGICKASDLLGFKFDRSSVLVRILKKQTCDEFIITDIHSVSASEVERTVHALKVWHELLMTGSVRSTAKRPASDLLENLTPSPAIKRTCRSLQRNLTDA